MNRAKLIEKLEKKEEFEYLFFLGHREKDIIDENSFSQWYNAGFITDEGYFLTAEHYMMIKKAQLFKDKEIELKIKNSKILKEVKLLGREVKNFNQNIWNKEAYKIVKEANLNKFSQNKKLKEYLISTSPKILVEASPTDPIWGIGLSKDNPKSKNPKEWQGENLLGFALMEVRDILKTTKFS